jgi:hypothetical protein
MSQSNRDTHLLPKAEVLRLLARSGVPPQTIAEIADRLGDPVDLHTDGALLQSYGLTRDGLISELGGSP